MANFDINAFDFSAITAAQGASPFDQKTTYKKDERFYTLGKDENGNGAAIIAFLPDVNKNLFKKVFKINTTVINNGKRRFLNTLSPYTISMPCPFNEAAVRLWNEGDKDGYKLFHPQKRYITNIKVLKDPACPANEGKIFMYEMSQRLLDKLQAALSPSEQDIALGEQRKEIFNPLRGWVFKLVANKKNNMTSYDDSVFIRCEKVGYPGSIYGSIESQAELQQAGEKAVEEIKTKTYNLDDLLKPEQFMSYEVLTEKLQNLAGGMYGIPAKTTTTGQNVQINDNTSSVSVEVQNASEVKVETTKPTEKVEKQQSAEDDEIDALLGL